MSIVLASTDFWEAMEVWSNGLQKAMPEIDIKVYPDDGDVNEVEFVVVWKHPRGILKKYPNLNMPRKSDLCYATTNRQEAVINVSSKVDVVLVVGSDTSSNTKALVSTIKNLGKESFRVNTTEEIENLDLKDKNVAVTAGASAPDHIVQEIINKLQPNETIYFENTNETEYFPLPKELRSNITTVSNFLLELFPENKVEPVRSVNKDKQWSATEALASP